MRGEREGDGRQEERWEKKRRIQKTRETREKEGKERMMEEKKYERGIERGMGGRGT